MEPKKIMMKERDAMQTILVVGVQAAAVGIVNHLYVMFKLRNIVCARY